MTAANLNTIRAAFMRRASAPDINPYALKLAYLLAYKYLNNETGTARPSQDTLARDLNVTTRTVRTLLDILQPLGLVILPGHGPNRASTYWIDPDKATSVSPMEPEKRKPASGYKRKPASGSEPNTGNLAHDNRKLDDQIPEASFHPTKKKNQEEEPIVADANASATWERERSRALAVIPGAPAPSGGARRKEKFEALVAIWQRGHGDEDRVAAWKAFVAECGQSDEIADEILASGHRWVAAYQHEPNMLKPLWKWLALGTWKNLPPPPKPKRGNSGGKVSAAEWMRRQGEQS